MSNSHCDFRTTALHLAALGYRVFPLKPLSKEPAISRWQDAATTDIATIETWAKTHSDANVGIVGGQGLLILDADNDAAENALMDALDTALPALGPVWNTFFDWRESRAANPPEGPFVLTQGDGLHVYLRVPVGSDLAAVSTGTNWCGVKGLDTRAKGGFVVAPGCIVLAKHDGEKWRAQPGKAKDRAAWGGLPGQPELRAYRGNLPLLSAVPASMTLTLGGIGMPQAAPTAPGVSVSPAPRPKAPLVAPLSRPAELTVVADALATIARAWAAAGECSNGDWQSVVMALAGTQRRGQLIGTDGAPATNDEVRDILVEFSQAAPGYDDAAPGRIDHMLATARGERGLGSLFSTAKAAGWTDPRTAAVSSPLLSACPLELKDHADMSHAASGTTRKAAMALARTCTVRNFIRFDPALVGFRAYDAAAGAWVAFDVLSGTLHPALIPLHNDAIREAKEHLRSHTAVLEDSLRADHQRARDGTDETSLLAAVVARYAATAAADPAAIGHAQTLVAK